MTNTYKTVKIAIIATILLCSVPLAVQAQIYNKKKSEQEGTASAISEHNARVMAPACVNKWETQECLRATSQSALEMAATYAEKLDKAGHKDALEVLKDQCAAATAATRGQYPAYAMTSAYTECANIIVDISDETGINPDQSHYQLLVGAVLCLTKDPRCRVIEQGLNKYR